MKPLVLLVGTGSQIYREYLLRQVSVEFDVVLFSERDMTWEAPHVVSHMKVDTTDVEAMSAHAERHGPNGVLTWDDTRVVQTAVLAQRLGLPGSPPDAALRCRDKHLTRAALQAASVPQARSILVDSLSEARAAGTELGFPLVLKPRALNGSMGVVKVDAPEQLAGRFRVARGANAPGVTEVAPGGVLVEEYLDGPEISIDVAWQDGRMTPAFVARKRVGFPPYFEEIGHLVDGGDPLLEDRALHDVLVRAHAAIGFDTGWTHTEVRLTSSGPKIVEINARLGGDRIPGIARLALGVEAATAAAAIACGLPFSLQSTRREVAGVEFVYPERDCIVRSVSFDRGQLPATVTDVEPIAVPGQELKLPPAGHVSSRYALITVVAPTQSQCLADLRTASAAVRLAALQPVGTTAVA